MAKAIEFYGILIFAIIQFLENSEAIICYQCADSKSSDDCMVDVDRLRKSALTYLETNGTIGGEHYRADLKNCTSEWGNYCVTEHYTNQRETLSFIRGCSSGSSDTSIPDVRSFSLSDEHKCRYYPDSKDHILACVTWCNFNFCNGPTDYNKFLVATTNASCRPLLNMFVILVQLLVNISER